MVRMTIWAIIKKNMTIMAYWMTAVMSPICRLPKLIYPPLSSRR